MKNLRLLLAGSLAVASIGLLPVAAQADEGTATVSVLHGVPGATVDVYANGEALLTGFEPGTLTDPLQLPAGDYDLKVVAAGAGADGDAVIEADGVTVPADVNVTVVAHLDAGGSPVLTPFVNDTAASDEGARLTVRHVAAAPDVDVRAGGDVAVAGLANPEEAKLDIAAGDISADVVAAGSDTVVLGPADLSLADMTNTIVYAWGSLEDENLALAVQTVAITGDHAGLPHTGAEGPVSANTGLVVAASLAMVGLATGIAVRRRVAA